MSVDNFSIIDLQAHEINFNDPSMISCDIFWEETID